MSPQSHSDPDLEGFDETDLEGFDETVIIDIQLKMMLRPPAAGEALRSWVVDQLSTAGAPDWLAIGLADELMARTLVDSQTLH